MASRTSHATTNHEVIRRWAESRGGHPTHVRGTGFEDGIGILRIDFDSNGPEENLQEISWDLFFEQFDAKDLVFLYQDKTKDGEESRFFKFINREHLNLEIETEVPRNESRPRNRSKNRDVVNRLNKIIKADLEVVLAYQEAVNTIGDPQLREEIKRFCDQHEQQILELENLIFALGGEPTALNDQQARGSRNHH